MKESKQAVEKEMEGRKKLRSREWKRWNEELQIN